MAYDGSIKIDTAIDGSGFKAGLGKLGDIAGSALSAMTTAIAGTSAALAAGAAVGVKYNAQMEQYMTSFTTMLGSAEKATGMVGQLKKFAAETPFEFTDLANGSQTLLSFGVSAEKLQPTLKMLGDVSQGNTDKFNSLSLAFGQVSSAGKMSGQDLLQFINAGFNPLNEISKKTGESMSDLRDRMAKGGISAQEVADAFESATNQGGMFFNAMQSQSKTFNGQLSTLKDNAMSFLGDLTQGFTDSLKDTALPMVNGYLTELSNAFKSGGINGVVSALGNVLSNALTQVAQQAPGIINMAVSLIQSFVTGIQTNSSQLSTAAVNIITSLVTGIITLLPQILETGGNLLLSFAQGITEQLPTLITKAIDAIYTLRQGLIDNLPTIIQTAFQIISSLISGIGQALPQLIPQGINAIITLVESLLDNIDLIIDAAIDIIIGLANGLVKAIPLLIEKIPIIIEKLISAIWRNMPKLYAAVFEMLGKVAGAILEIDWGKLGFDLIAGIVKGIWDGVTHIDWKGIGNNILNGLKDFFGIHSPSRLLRDEIGKMLPPGISIGFEKAMPGAISDMQAQMDVMVGKMQSGVASEQVGSSYSASSFSGLAGSTPIIIQPAPTNLYMDSRKFASSVTNSQYTDKMTRRL